MQPARAKQLTRGAVGFVRSRLGGSPRPLSITYHVTYRCNLRCSYCLLPYVGKELPTDEAIDLIHRFAHRGAVRLGFLGGEPLLRNDLGELVAAARAEGMIVSVVTNATLLEGRMDMVRDVDALMISLDGEKDVHDAHRGEGTFATATRGLELALAGGLQVTLVAVVSAQSLDHLDGTLRLAERYGVSVLFQPVVANGERIKPGAGEAYESLVLSQDEATRTFGILERWKRAGRPIANTMAYLKGMQRDAIMPIGGHCPAVRAVLAVLPDGRLAPCCEQHRAAEPKSVDLSRPLGERLANLGVPACDQCTSVGNSETRNLVRMDPFALASAFDLVRPRRRRATAQATVALPVVGGSTIAGLNK